LPGSPCGRTPMTTSPARPDRDMLTPSKSTTVRFLHGISNPSPALMSQRGAESPQLRVVGRFLSIAPMLLHGGHSTQCPPQAAQFDWWAECIDNELVGSMARGVVGPMGLDLPPTIQDGQEIMHEPMGLEPPPPEQDGLKMLHEGSLTRSPRPAPLEDHDADWWLFRLGQLLRHREQLHRHFCNPSGQPSIVDACGGLCL
jgi:hypothetical protein